jgi:hypothetical protein
MSIQKLERVLWRLRQLRPGEKRFTNLELQRVIMVECGTDPGTYVRNRIALKKLGWIIPYRTRRIDLTNKDIVSSE